MDYEPVIGLETHVELLTASKLWCRCSTRFGAEPNTQTCPVCLGMPGVLPVLNAHALELALRAALALGCTVSRTTMFDRKNYYYPDLPKNYQISQNHANLGIDGHLDIPVEGTIRRVGILNVHLEEDAGKNLHVEDAGADCSLVDLNRAGTPLLEVVSAPDMQSVEEADSYMETLRRLLLYAGVSDCKMQEGSLRFEASVSMRPAGSSGLGTRVEVKNLNSMRAVCGALAYEIRRQAGVLDGGGTVAMETRLWDEARDRTAAMRSKEEAEDYRYFPEPDLLPVAVTDEMIQRVGADVPELPLARRGRFMEQYGLSDYNASVLTDTRAQADYFEECLKAHDAPVSVANWVLNEVLRVTNERRITLAEFEVGPAGMGDLVRLLDQGRINAAGARGVMARMVETSRSAEELVREMGLEQVSDEAALEPIIAQVIEQNPEAVRDYLGGKAQAVGALVGQVMRVSRGKADPRIANRMLRERLDAMEN